MGNVSEHTDSAGAGIVGADLADLHAVWRIRALEEKIRELRLGGSVVGSVHLAIGQEAGPVGAAGIPFEHDVVLATYRGHGWAMSCGVPLEALLAEVLGRETGVNGGRGGSAYLSAPAYRFLGENSIVGGGLPIAAGAALAGRFDGTDRTALVVFGDGAMNQGSVHEAMNFASSMRLPVVFYCENNGWSEMTPIKAMVGDGELYRRARSYGMPGERINGNDPTEVRERLQDAFALAREGGGPSLLEALTPRLAGHYIGDAEQYRPAEDLELARQADPVQVLGRRLSAAEAAEAELRARREIDEAAARAMAAPLADPATARLHVYA